ncbi:MAG: STAS domain-containing protein [Methylovulum miyakonense]|uniref:STAS domain-containing protein n=1 Tax=Methylovulum miyakonense TaxID=645578 RepID=UPI003BB79231
MDITTQLDGDEMRIALNGRLDAAWSNSVNKTLQDAIRGGSHRIALDLSQVSYLSSAGIRVLVLLVKSLKGIGGTLRLIDPSPAVSEVLKLVGFSQLLDTVPTPASPSLKPAGPSPAKADAQPEPRPVKLAGQDFVAYTLDAGANQQGVVIEKNAALRPQAITVPEGTWVIGHGALGGADNAGRAGELLAVSGLAISLPGDDPEHPDWMQQEGGLIPEVSLLHGLKAAGGFRHLLRFGETPGTPPLRLGELAQAALEACASDTVSFVLVAEAAHLIGAALQVPPDPDGDDFFAFPSVRDRLLFTAEPAYTGETCLIVGVAARNPPPRLATQTRPNAAGSELSLHAHACVVPFSPVRKGFIGLPETLGRLLETQTLRGVLHLLNDDREGVGAGESYLWRGALWCAPVNFNAEGSV